MNWSGSPWISRELEDKEYRSKRKIVTKKKTPDRTRQLVQLLDYSRYKSERSVRQFDHTWSPGTFVERPSERKGWKDNIKILWEYREMTKQVEKSGVDKIMELFMKMRQDDKEREDRRLKDIQEREERREIKRERS